jgi:hypothetical protein
MVMKSSLIKNIFLEIKKLKEQNPDPNSTVPPADSSETNIPTPETSSPAPAEPTSDVSASAQLPPSDMSSTDMSSPGAVGSDSTVSPPSEPATEPESGEENQSSDGEEGTEEDTNQVPPGQPPVDLSNPTGAVVDYIKDLKSKTIDSNTIVKAAKAGIQSNFANVQDAESIINDLKNPNYIDIARKLELFITGKITENTRKGSKNMKVSKQEIRELVREAVKANMKPVKKEVALSGEQFEKIVRNAVIRKLNEGAIFDKRRSIISQERSSIENQLLSTDIREMAIDLFEKICQKAGLDADSLTPEAMQFVEAELDRMLTSAQELSNKLIQVAAVVKTAASGASKSEEGQG